jgi:hypothetical protein
MAVWYNVLDLEGDHITTSNLLSITTLMPITGMAAAARAASGQSPVAMHGN